MSWGKLGNDRHCHVILRLSSVELTCTPMKHSAGRVSAAKVGNDPYLTYLDWHSVARATMSLNSGMLRPYMPSNLMLISH